MNTREEEAPERNEDADTDWTCRYIIPGQE